MKHIDTDTVHTSSGGLFTFCRYFFTTSSGVLPADRKEREQEEGEERKKTSVTPVGESFPKPTA